MRKNLLCLALMICILSVSNAQIKKGSVLLGGDLNFRSSIISREGTSNESKYQTFYLSPVVGKAIKDNLVVGVSAGYRMEKNDDELGGNHSNGNSYSAGIFVRKYFNIGKGGFYVFTQSGINGSMDQLDSESTGSPIKSKIKSHSVSINAYPGLSYAISRRFHIETGLNSMLYLSYSKETRIHEPAGLFPIQKTSSFQLSTSLNNFQSNLYFGFRVLLAKS